MRTLWKCRTWQTNTEPSCWWLLGDYLATIWWPLGNSLVTIWWLLGHPLLTTWKAGALRISNMILILKLASTGASAGACRGIILGMSGASSGACLGQHLGHIVNSGQQSAVLHASVMPFLWKAPSTAHLLSDYYQKIIFRCVPAIPESTTLLHSETGYNIYKVFCVMITKFFPQVFFLLPS